MTARAAAFSLALLTAMAANAEGPVRVFFGHQSVGGNLLDGARARAPALFDGSGPVRVEDALVGVNGKPETKLAAFEQYVDAHALEVAMVKFCYVDFDAGTGVQALFERYVAVHERLRQRHPGLRLAHVTTPLATVQTGVKAVLKRWTGRLPGGVAENARRSEFNELLRAKYQGREPLFDLAALEATTPAGAPAVFEGQGLRVPALDPGWTDDGGHLNAAARERFGGAFAAFLAALGKPAAAQ